jgi:hypothetical protein
MLLSEAVDERWELTVDGAVQERRTAFGWATAWDLVGAGDGAFTYRTSVNRYLLVGLQILLAVGALVLVRTLRHGPPFGQWLARRRVAARPAPTVIDLTGEQGAPPGRGVHDGVPSGGVP